MDMSDVKQDSLPASGLPYLTDAPSTYIGTDPARSDLFEIIVQEKCHPWLCWFKPVVSRPGSCTVWPRHSDGNQQQGKI